jgi:hypothetical protein
MVRRALSPPGPSGQGTGETIVGLGNLPHSANSNGPGGASGAMDRDDRYAQAMSPHPRPTWLRRARSGGIAARDPRSLVVVFVALVAIVVAGCGGSSSPVVSFDPSSACTTDGQQPGAYPDLEALLPKQYDGRAPDHVDSGRNCTPGALGSLADAGVKGVRFAGATWDLGGTNALTVAVFDGAGLTAENLLQFYVDGAQADSHTDKASTSTMTVGGKRAQRLDVLASNGTGQTIVTWPAATAGRVSVVLASDLGDAKVAAALQEFGGQ